jgi:hypothetical protein
VSRKLPSTENIQTLSNDFVHFFTSNVLQIRSDLDSTTVDMSLIGISHSATPPVIDTFHEVNPDELLKVIQQSPTKSCTLDPLPTHILKNPAVLHSLVPHLTSVVNASIASSEVPSCLKEALISPLLKKDGLNLDDMKNYRPVANLSFVSKTLERVIAKQIQDHMTQHQLHDPLQSAYKPRHSTETALLRIKSDIDCALDRGQGVVLLLLDLSAAFDALDHNILFERLTKEVGIQGKALDWCKSYLTSRTHRINLSGTLSDPAQLTVGVPQGSVLGPLLFLIYILPLRRVIEAFPIDRHGYADETQLYDYFILNDLASLTQTLGKLENCAASVRAWMTMNKLKLNDAKTELLIIAPKFHLSKIFITDPKMTIGSAEIRPVKSVRNLGVQYDAIMNMECQTRSVVKSIFFHIRRIAKVRNHLDDETAARTINALVTSRLDNNNGLLAGTSTGNIHRLQLAQNASARLLTRTRKYDHIGPILLQLHWLPVER